MPGTAIGIARFRVSNWPRRHPTQSAFLTSLPRGLTPATLVNHISWNSLAARMPDPLLSYLLENDQRLQRLHRGSWNLNSSPRAWNVRKVPEGAFLSG